MARTVTCADGCGRDVRLSNGDLTGVCPRCRAERQRIERAAEDARQHAVLRRLVRRGAVPKAIYEDVTP